MMAAKSTTSYEIPHILEKRPLGEDHDNTIGDRWFESKLNAFFVANRRF